ATGPGGALGGGGAVPFPSGPCQRPARGATRAMRVSFFETARYQASQPLPPEWPIPSGPYDPRAGGQASRGMIERLQYVEELGFDWVSVSEHHYSPRILTPSPIVAAAFLAAHLKRVTIALLGPIVSQSNPVRVAEEIAMLDTMAQ